MIVVELADLRDQVVLTPNMEKAARFLARPGLAGLPDGPVEIDGERVYASVQSYETNRGDITEFEGHRRYIDVQYVAGGEEIISYVSAAHATQSTAYDDETDYWGTTAPADRITDVRLVTGQVAVLYPVDLHVPRRAVASPAAVKKIVVKVALDG